MENQNKKLKSKLFTNNIIIKNKMAKVLGGRGDGTNFRNPDGGGTDTIDRSTSERTLYENGKPYSADMIHKYLYRIIRVVVNGTVVTDTIR